MGPIAVAGAIELASQVHTAIKGGTQAASKYAELFGNKSLTDIGRVAQVEPILLVDSDCLYEECITDVAQALQSMFTGYYLQAVNMMSTINGVTVAQRLGPLNPNRGMGFEERILATREQINAADKGRSYKLSLEAAPAGKRSGSNRPPASAATDDKILDTVREATNLSIGRMYNVVLTEDNISVTVPVMVRLLAQIVPSRTMVDLFCYRDDFDMDMRERWHGVRSGRLSFFKDFILCNDLLDKRRKAAIVDGNGLLQTINARESKNIVSGFMNGKGSVANASNMTILSTETMEQIEQEIGGSFDNSRIRKTVFENSNLMIIAVVDKSWKRVRFYHRGMDASSSVSYRELAAKAGSEGVSVTDILKAYMSGSAPAL